MMNHHLPAGPSHIPQTALPAHSSPMQQHHSQSRRQQEYHHQFHQQQVAHNPYAQQYAHHPGAQAYYGHPGAHMGYAPQQRWMPPAYGYPMHQHHQHQYQQHQQPQYPPRSPVVVSSQPQMAGMPQPVTRQTSMPYMAPPAPAPSQSPLHQLPVAQSPLYHAPLTPTTSIPQSLPSPRPASVQTSTPSLPASRRSSAAQPLPAIRRMPFYPDLPWYSVTDEPFPAKASKRRRKRQDLTASNDAVTLPSRGGAPATEAAADVDQSDVSTVAAPSQLPSAQETPATSQAPSEADVSVAAPSPAPAESSKPATPQGQAKKDARPAIPILPAVPAARPKTASSETVPTPASTTEQSAPANAQADAPAEGNPAEPATPAPKAAPKSWADLMRSKNSAAAAAATASTVAVNGASPTNGAPPSRASTLAGALKQFNVDDNDKIAFLEPRGLVNTGNMCYMNSILQILVYCMPFYNFLDQVSKRAAHSFKSDTPLVDAMIMFMREFKTIDSAESAEKLRMRLKDQELEQYGDSITPEYVYDTIKQLPRFSSMRRGHQQDAEEFLGFLLDGIHDECMTVMRKAGVDSDESAQPASPSGNPSGANTDAGWLEVGPKQKQSVTRQSGESLPTPITRIFGGSLRSELRVPGLKNSVTMEPYQPLQLDIGAPDVNNIIQALKAITKPETLTGDFGSPRGPGTTAVKQVFIESLPPVLILHLKRFQYDNTGGTQKIWKKVGYPLELEIPKDVFAPQKRGGLAVQGGAPKYRLTSVVYHHGKSAAGGHYTVDILRQDEREWVRVDDTIIRRIRPEDVAEGGSEEDPKVLARALEQHKADQDASKRNLFEGLDGDDDTDSVRSWNEVNGANKKPTWTSAVANGSSSGKRTPLAKDKSSVKDNKVAYILLYEKMTG
ncbi:cysteine proteinase [Aureobasidium pullulans]|uniref:Ubiquitin carboxyl-terminal hydrolase n=1 Tax=Aureobasidium pullulans TaxID=5580 RepID=A0A4S8S9D7_AURPU|nr:cysteine proteinase [Aureobasidium pullulans]